MKIAILLLVLLVNCAHPAPSNQGVANYGIYGGQDATYGQFPYQVSIWACTWYPAVYKCTELCGGAIISPSWIVTAAQCYWEVHIRLRIAAGYIDSSQLDLFNGLLDLGPTFAPADYKEGPQPSNDIRLYRLDKPLNFNFLMNPVKLPKQNSNVIGGAVITGWGSSLTNKTGHSSVLQYQRTNIPDGQTCLNLANAIGSNNFSVTTHVCTENPEKDQGLCGIDIGGPLVQNGTLVGIASWIPSSCGQKNVPSVYTRVSNYVDWITDIVTDPLNYN